MIYVRPLPQATAAVHSASHGFAEGDSPETCPSSANPFLSAGDVSDVAVEDLVPATLLAAKSGSHWIMDEKEDDARTGKYSG